MPFPLRLMDEHSRQISIAYCIAGTYRAAGMERILTLKANYLDSLGYKVIIITTDQEGRIPAFMMSPGIKQIDLGIGYERTNGSSFIKKALLFPYKHICHKQRLKRVLKQITPDVTVSMFCNDVNILPSITAGGRKILEVHFSRFKRLLYGRKGLWGIADRLLSYHDQLIIRKYDKFVTLTKEDLINWGNPTNGICIPNFINSIPEYPSLLNSKTVISVGRLTYQKGIDRLLEAWSRSSAKDRQWHLKLIGEGEQKKDLQMMIKSLGISDTVELAGEQRDMDTVYRNASVLVLSSRYEGMPMVLLEAQSYGIPCISFDCQCGPRDIITDGENGRLVANGDIIGLAEAIDELTNDNKTLQRMGATAYSYAARWDMQRIMKLWTNLFESEL